MLTSDAQFILSLCKSVCHIKCKGKEYKNVLGLMLGIPGTHPCDFVLTTASYVCICFSSAEESFPIIFAH